MSTSPPHLVGGAVDSLTCQWGDCRERCTSPESLYDHVCERHVGRKSTNNLNLTCQWGACNTTTVKRDHITSHIRVHVPLKPHKCEFCGKAFKRPQDLKKHVKTHADESVILRSPDQSASAPRPPMNNGYGNHAPKHNGYMNDGASYGNASYGHYQAPAHSFYGHAGAATASAPGFAPVYYNIPQAVGLAGGAPAPVFDTRKGHDSLNHFFRDVKNNEIDPSQYYDLGQRLGNVNSLGLPVFSGMQGAYPGPMDMGAGTAVAYGASALPQPAYGLPFSELKTKNDLMSIDQFLQQLQETVYEHSDTTGSPTASTVSSNMHMSANGAAQVRHLSDASLNVPYSGSPAVHTPGASSMTSDTPALTPASYSSHSPASMHSSQVASTPPSTMASAQPLPQRQPMSNSNLYPQLPSLSSLHDSPSPNHYPPTTGAPASGLGNSFDEYDGRRRYSLGYLQRAQPTPARTGVATSLHRESLERTAAAAKTPMPAEPGEFARRNSDPKSDTSDDLRQEAWVNNMKVIEALRAFVKERLEKRDYSESPAAGRLRDRDQDMPDAPSKPAESSSSLYPILRPIQG